MKKTTIVCAHCENPVKPTNPIDLHTWMYCKCRRMKARIKENLLIEIVGSTLLINSK